MFSHPDRDTTTFHQRWHSALLFSDRMSQIAEPSHVQLCLCNPNTGRNAKSSHPAVVSHPGYCAVVWYGMVWCQGWKGPWKSKGDRVFKKSQVLRVNLAWILAPFWGLCAKIWLNFSWRWLCQNVEQAGQGRRATAKTLAPTAQACHWSAVVVVSTWHSQCVHKPHKY